MANGEPALDCCSSLGKAVAFIDAAALNLRQAERLFTNHQAYGDASKDFIQDPEVIRWIARCFARRYHKITPEVERALIEIITQQEPTHE